MLSKETFQINVHWTMVVVVEPLELSKTARRVAQKGTIKEHSFSHRFFFFVLLFNDIEFLRFGSIYGFKLDLYS